MNDVGLLRKMSNLDGRIIAKGNKLFEEFKGAFSENFVLNMLENVFKIDIHYYTFDRHEIDFIIQYENEITPIEVKANKSTNNISLTRYNEKFNNTNSIRFSMNNLSKNGKIINVPLFMAEYVKKFL